MADHLQVPKAISNAYTEDEASVLTRLMASIDLSTADRDAITAEALRLVSDLRSDGRPIPLMDALLQEYGLSSEEGVALMRLSEALIRTPDFATSRKLVRDKLINADWRDHAGQAPVFLVNQATNGLRLSKGWIKASGGIEASNLAAKLGDRVLEIAMNRVMAIMAEHFVLGRNIQDATDNARAGEAAGQTYSYDMLGEAALTQADANTYFEAYKRAVEHLASNAGHYASIQDAPGISVKLSALHPRYEYAQRAACVPHLVAKLTELCTIAKQGNLSLAIDAEETDRLEISLHIFGKLLATPELADWDGLGLVVQSYQRRAMPVLERIVEMTRAAGRKITVRLVKGAYWDSEIKRAQEMGLASYPVFTRKENTDVSYLACAKYLLSAGDVIFPQFATHNAHTAAAIAYMASNQHPFEVQRLHGMGKALHEALGKTYGVRSRIYAPVGAHEDLLPYLVRRLLENGANSSFVNQMFDEDVEEAHLVADPITEASGNADAANPKLTVPRDIAEPGRLMAAGLDLTQANVAASTENAMPLSTPLSMTPNGADSTQIEIKNPANLTQTIGQISTHSINAVDIAIASAKASSWPNFPVEKRAACLNRAADLLEAEMVDFIQLCTLEAGKTQLDGVSEVREAVDFCRYYAHQALSERIGQRSPLGVIGCISPWNFPLAIFLGQIAASLSVGNTVVAKPAPQTPLISQKTIKLLIRAGVPADAVHLLIGDGVALGTALTQHSGISGVCFTGSTATAKAIGRALAKTGRAAIPFIAETGGINAMVIDSTALLEQAVKDVVASAFQSAGQRCSACRVVCVQEEIADDFITMLAGAMAELVVGDPKHLTTDVGPVIDADAKRRLSDYISQARKNFTVVGEVEVQTTLPDGHFVQPICFGIKSIKDVKQEVFGPVLHVARFKASKIDHLIDDINATGFGLTMGLHTRLDHRIEEIADRIHVGNLYVNRNQIGAVVGVQPFGGEGLSGTGPKAGGPNYLLRLSRRSDHAGEILPALEQRLPGPTGETNTLTLHPRGTILCLGGDTPDALERQIERVHQAGNKVIAAMPDVASPSLKRAEKTITYCTQAEAEVLLETGAIDAVMAEGALLESASARLSERAGPILQVLSADDDAERFYHERTVTINTTAAGGNASLLAMD